MRCLRGCGLYCDGHDLVCSLGHYASSRMSGSKKKREAACLDVRKCACACYDVSFAGCCCAGSHVWFPGGYQNHE